MKAYAFSFRYDGERYGFVIEAPSLEAAREQIARVSFAQYEGEVSALVPRWMPLWLARLWYGS